MIEGADLMVQDEMPRELFVIETGTVGIIHDDLLIAELGAGEVVGEIGLVDPQRRTATVRARTAGPGAGPRVRRARDLDADMPEIVRELRAIARRRLDELDKA